MRDRSDVQAGVTGLHRWEVVEPVAPGGEPRTVRVRDAFRFPGRATGVADDVPVVRIDEEVRVDRGLLAEPRLVPVVPDQHVFERRHALADTVEIGGVVRTHHDCPTSGVRQHVVVALDAVAGVERDPHQAGDRRAGEEVLRLDRVVLQHPDAVSGPEAEREQAVGHAHAPVPRLGEREPPLAVDDGGAVLVELRRLAHESGDVHR